MHHLLWDIINHTIPQNTILYGIFLLTLDIKCLILELEGIVRYKPEIPMKGMEYMDKCIATAQMLVDATNTVVELVSSNRIGAHLSREQKRIISDATTQIMRIEILDAIEQKRAIAAARYAQREFDTTTALIESMATSMDNLARTLDKLEHLSDMQRNWLLSTQFTSFERAFNRFRNAF